MKKKRIALLVAQADEEYQSDFIRGVMEKAFSRDIDVFVFSMYIKYQNSKARELGEANIYNLVNYSLFDGVIVLSDMIQTPGVETKIQERIRTFFPGPVVCVDTESPYFPTFWTDGYRAVYDTVSHLIEEHGMKDIAYLSGRESHVHSIRRMEAFRAAMKDHDLPIRQDREFFGDFWYFSGTHCAEALLRDRDALPEAVVCANDPMAIGLAIGLSQAGLRIPEDIAIAGYGSSEEGQTSPVPITSPRIPGSYYGGFAVEALLHQMEGQEIGEPDPETTFYVGESCGCKPEAKEKKLARRTEWSTENSEGGFLSLHDFLKEDMLLADSVEEFFRTVYDYVYLLTGVRRMDIFLNEQWQDPEALVKNRFPSEGYPEKMIHVMAYDTENSEGSVERTGRVIQTDQMIDDEEEQPKGHFFVPLFFEEKTFGYAVFDYGGAVRSFDTVTRHWMNSVCRGLEVLRRSLSLKEYEKIVAVDVQPKFPVPDESLKRTGEAWDQLTEEERKERLEVAHILDENLLKYHFQPIVRAQDGEIYSYEALMRSGSEWKIPPLQIIRHADGLGRLQDIEKYTFLNVMGIVDAKSSLFEGKKVFINSIPGIRLKEEDGRVIGEMFRKHADRVVVELTEQAELEDETLEQLKQRLRSLGIGIAVDDYGTGYSNVSNLLRYMPDCVKIDRSLLTEIQISSQKQHFVRNIIEFCHENQILALAEGVETREELQAVIRLGADLIQGYYVARPSEEILTSVDSAMKMEISRFYRERLDGMSDQVYVAGKTSRVTMNSLIKEDKTTIIIGEKDATYRDITIAGNPNVSSNIHIEILEGYHGIVTLENVTLSNKKQRPCIRMAENAELTLRLAGENRLEGGGILVPESSTFRLEGDGNIRIRLDGTEVYGIGAGQDEAHGALEFYQEGEVAIESTGKSMTGIGSGLGGSILIAKGKYSFYMSGSEGVGIGSVTGEENLLIHDCELTMDFSFREGICIGSMYGSMSLETMNALLRFSCGGTKVGVIGTLSGEHAKVFLHDLSVHINVRSDNSSAFGSLKGSSDIRIHSAAVRYKAAGMEAYIFGGKNPDSDVHVDNTDFKVRMETIEGGVTSASRERCHFTMGMADILVNYVEQEF